MANRLYERLRNAVNEYAEQQLDINFQGIKVLATVTEEELKSLSDQELKTLSEILDGAKSKFYYDGFYKINTVWYERSREIREAQEKAEETV